jgi:hypothetical protein
MQKEHPKGYYFNSSYRKARGLRTLIHGLFHHKRDKESDTDDYSHHIPTSFAKSEKGPSRSDPPNSMKKEAS